MVPITLKKLRTPGEPFTGGWVFLIEILERVYAFETMKMGLFSHRLETPQQRIGVYLIVNAKTTTVYVGSAGDVVAHTLTHRRDLVARKHPNKRLKRDYHPDYKPFYDVCFFFCNSRGDAYRLEQWLLDELRGRDCRIANVNLDVSKCRVKRRIPEFHKPEFEQKHYLELSHPEAALGRQGGFHDL